MERIFVVMVLLLGAPTLVAQDISVSEDSNTLEAKGSENIGTPEASDIAPPAKETKKIRRKKYRSGSFLIRNKPIELEFDIRSDFERKRDFELIQHFRRLAELAVIESLAAKSGDSAIAERVEQIRRVENQRYREALKHLRLVARYNAEVGTK